MRFFILSGDNVGCTSQGSACPFRILRAWESTAGTGPLQMASNSAKRIYPGENMIVVCRNRELRRSARGSLRRQSRVGEKRTARCSSDGLPNEWTFPAGPPATGNTACAHHGKDAGVGRSSALCQHLDLTTRHFWPRPGRRRTPHATLSSVRSANVELGQRILRRTGKRVWISTRSRPLRTGPPPASHSALPAGLGESPPRAPERMLSDACVEEASSRSSRHAAPTARGIRV